MFESYILTFFILVSAVFVLLVIVFFIVGNVKKDNQIIKVSFLTLVFPVLIFTSLIYWYAIEVPLKEKELVREYYGSYIICESSFHNLFTLNRVVKQHELLLSLDGAVKFDSIPNFNMPIKGSWKIEEIDGDFGFYGVDGSLKLIASTLVVLGKDKLIFKWEQNSKEYITFIKK